MQKSLLYLSVLLIGALNLNAMRYNFDENWKFSLGDPQGAEATTFEDKHWRQLDLPHDWSIEGDYDENNPMSATCGYLPAGIGWYRKTIQVEANWKDKHVEISFDGVYRNSTVWVNGKELGTRPYGWISFSYDLTEAVKSSDKLTIAVRVDNSLQPAARWYTGSGIYAHTWLNIREPIHVANNGVFVRSEGSKIFVDTEVNNCTNQGQHVRVSTSLLNRDGTVVAKEQTTTIAKAAEFATTKQILKVNNPTRWSTESPYLYTAVTEIYVGNNQVDRKETRFGIRDIVWKADTGMWIDGKNVKLRGVCNHQDAGALGAAVPDKILRYRIQQLKDMGCNAIRTAHNPQTPIFYELCDEMGMLVMDEIFDGWKRKAAEDYGKDAFKKWWYRDLSDWIKRDRNHPSIVIYSVGNETNGEVGKELVERCHELDNTRLVTSGHSGSEYMDVLGVNGSSEKMGWFEKMPNDRPFIGTENTHTWQVRGYYRTKTWYRDGYPHKNQRPYPCPDLTEEEVFTHDWIDESDRNNGKQIFNSSYDNAMVRLTTRLNIEQLRDIPNYAGSFRWTGYDYIGEAGYVHGGWPFKSFMGGAIDMANFEKDLYYLYQSQWTDEPMIHILPHWTHPKVDKGTLIPVWVYSNCDEVELFFNGESLGKQNPGENWDEMQCQWMVNWEPGELKAIAYQNGKAIHTQTVRTATSPAQIELSIDGEPLLKNKKDIVQIRVASLDRSGEFYPYGENRSFFKVYGPAIVRALDNGSPVDVEKHFEATNRKAFYGLTRAYIESQKPEGDIALLTGCILGEKKLITSKKVYIDLNWLPLRGDPTKPKFSIYYTTDGTRPTAHSKHYEGAFPVELGTTVKAVVLDDGNEVLRLEERFAEDEGFTWNDGPSNYSAGSQAEEADLENCTVETKGEGFFGKGYVSLKNESAKVEWYQENDGGSGNSELWIRYAGRTKNKLGSKLQLEVNNKLIQSDLLFRNTKNPNKDWRYVKVLIPIERGANTIRLVFVNGDILNIDEISFH